LRRQYNVHRVFRGAYETGFIEGQKAGESQTKTNSPAFSPEQIKYLAKFLTRGDTCLVSFITTDKAGSYNSLAEDEALKFLIQGLKPN
jgi:hypothetical protein